MNYNENPDLIYEKEFAEKGYNRTLFKMVDDEKTVTLNQKRLEDSLRIIDPNYILTFDDINICNHQNFNDKNMLILASSLVIIDQYKKQGLKVSDIDETIINEYSKLIYEFSEARYNRSFSEHEVMNRINFSILSYILLIENTKKIILSDYNRIIELSKLFLDSEKYDEYLENLINNEDIINTTLDNYDDTILDYDIKKNSTYKFEGDIKDELLKMEIIEDNKKYKIIKFIYVGKYISIKTFFQELNNNFFINSFVNEIKNIYDYFGMEFIPLINNYDNDFEICIYESVKNNIKLNKYKKYMNNNKLVTLFRINKEINIIPVDNNKTKINTGIFSNLSLFLNEAKPEQIIDLFKLLAKTIKINIEKNKNSYITTNLDKDDWLAIKICSDDRYNKYIKNFSL